MTRAECESELKKLEARRRELVELITAPDVQSATHSAGGGSDSYTNRSVDDLEKKLRRVNREIAKLEARLGRRSDPAAIKPVFVRYQ